MNYIFHSRSHAIKVLIILFLSQLLLFVNPLSAQDDTYPTAERLFHIERNKNKNLVCYDANIVNGKLDTRKPLKVYWVNREESPGETKDLSAIQRRFAYGYKLRSEGDDSAEVTLTAYPDRVLTIRRQNGKYICTVMIDNKQAFLQSLYVKAKEGNFNSVEYVELKGVSMDDNKSVSERVEK